MSFLPLSRKFLSTLSPHIASWWHHEHLLLCQNPQYIVASPETPNRGISLVEPIQQMTSVKIWQRSVQLVGFYSLPYSSTTESPWSTLVLSFTWSGFWPRKVWIIQMALQSGSCKRNGFTFRRLDSDSTWLRERGDPFLGQNTRITSTSYVLICCCSPKYADENGVCTFDGKIGIQALHSADSST